MNLRDDSRCWLTSNRSDLYCVVLTNNWTLALLSVWSNTMRWTLRIGPAKPK